MVSTEKLDERRSSSYDHIQTMKATEGGAMETDGCREAQKALANALESGRFKQCFRALVRIFDSGEMRHSVFGVACRVYQERGGVLEERNVIDPVDGSTVVQFRSGPADHWRHWSLPYSVQRYFSFTTADGEYYDARGRRQSLANDNDGRSYGFVEIAATIREGMSAGGSGLGNLLFLCGGS